MADGALADAGATRWLETAGGYRNMPERVQDMTDRLAAGPPEPPGSASPASRNEAMSDTAVLAAGPRAGQPG